MRRRPRFSFLGAAVAASLLGAGPAGAYLCTEADAAGPSLYWEDRSVHIHLVDGDGGELNQDEIEAALALGVELWTEPTCSDFELVFAGAAADPRARFDWGAGTGNPPNENIVAFRADQGEQALSDAWLHPASALAIATITFVRQTGEILDADIEVNDARYAFSVCDPDDCVVQHDLLNALAHELGHVVGLDHPPTSQPEAREATMFAQAPEGETQKRDLSRDDIDGLCFLYPAGEDTGECTGNGREAPPDIQLRESGGCGGGLPLAGGLLAISLRRRRRT